jgi:hypothetical protein
MRQEEVLDDCETETGSIVALSSLNSNALGDVRRDKGGESIARDNVNCQSAVQCAVRDVLGIRRNN